jgi:hypothetical protein
MGCRERLNTFASGIGLGYDHPHVGIDQNEYLYLGWAAKDALRSMYL